MSAAQVERLQALLSRVQVNRTKPRATGSNGASSPLAQSLQALSNPPVPFAAPIAQDSIDTTPPPAAPPQPPVRASAEPVRRPAVEAEHVRVPDVKVPARSPAQPDRPMPVAARPTAPGATPLEMALEGEVARAAESAAFSQPAARPQPAMQAQAAAPAWREAEGGSRVLADPTPPQPTRPIAQSVTKHPPNQPHTFAELLKRSLALRPR